ncbi:uncharacterized protein wu:fc75a09 [Chanodichthys erythropterus]|uniref:uncharacterized protein wu:fc75a09 n=1 Tax=Chanodichthys erythropterus TaxID=933992 RepID=UPI00351E3C92
MGHKKQMKTVPKRITTIEDLKEYGFGQPWPRHGLKLLYWFAKDCVWVTDDDDMLLACDPAKGVFGFHLFENKESLLPDVDFPYYLLGNLNSPGADMLPAYVKKHNTSWYDESNTDRIIITDHGQKRFGKIYLTTHKDRSSYDPYATFHITRSLLKTIQSYPNLEDFLLTLGYEDGTSNQFTGVGLQMMLVQVPVDTDTPSRNCVCSCTIL